ncbi:MAG: hypothetical protein E6H07_13370 [Bacteroidetes bacterium]|nr:MAG: hypothetical protein E6H07_13370 [Bacteroidota bacterium]
MTNPLETYQQEITRLKAELNKLEKRKSLLGWLRLLSMGLALVSLWWLWTNGMFFLLPLPFLFIALFLFILTKDLNNNDAIENLERLIKINETEIEVLNHHFTHLPDGSQYKPEMHEYANDLDIFGRASLYQYINRTKSEQGNKLFSDWLLHPAEPEAILQRQHAVNELTTELNWRQQLQSYGTASPISISTQRKIDNWLKEPNEFSGKSYWRVLKYLLPVISFTLLILHLTDVLSSSAFYPLMILMLGISFIISKQVMPSYLQLDKVAPQLESLSGSIRWIEQKEFRSELLEQLKNKFKTGSGTSSQSIKKLKNILDRFDIRLNPLVFIPLNTFLFWDLQQIFVLEKWKKENKESIDEWFHALAEIECLSSLGNFHFNHSENSFPVISDQQGVFNAEELGHPLIPKEKLVCNSFATEGLNQMNLVTGSNMAGKSTFLRSIGVNIVLAMMGASVHARSLTLSPMKVLSSMRVSDNLEESTSTFYAELKKLKEVIDAVYNNEKVFLLLDEILRGTNSGDRHTGSKALIKQLIQHKAAGLIATHDLELAKLADEFPANIHNYHFDVQVANDELYFDYKLKRGVCQSMNASLLMKKIGIEL